MQRCAAGSVASEDASLAPSRQALCVPAQFNWLKNATSMLPAQLGPAYIYHKPYGFKSAITVHFLTKKTSMG